MINYPTVKGHVLRPNSNLQEIDFSKSDMRGADLNRSNLTYSDLRQSMLWGVSFAHCNLQSVNMSSCQMHNVSLYECDMRNSKIVASDLTCANLRRSDLSGSDLRSSNFSYAYLDGVNLDDCNLQNVVGDMRYIKSLMIERWSITYTHDILQIGCQRHAIKKWREWDTDGGKRWIGRMDIFAPEWAERFLPLVLAIIDTSPAKNPKQKS